MLTEKMELETETVNVKTIREYKESYDETDLSGINIPIHVDGTYHGWVDPEVAVRCGIDPDGSQVPEEKSSKHRNSYESAKEYSRKCLKTNPNTYFYRHVEPNTEHWTGDWTQEEIRAFCTTAEKFGCGDKWGLFATYIPHRVGYQCSNFYRQYILPKGLVIDPHYTITSNGEAIFHRKKSSVCQTTHQPKTR
ncbi:hypothetical protein JH06_1410 [Blastocystis sp. subtype 4]|uniref:hypothetical protein n=1 Tax=Blastocystis sp. subtype 4 TaxID=944170 RepID=UPI0007120D78|nr:hypothetical protein JH06_1410 [Blastocystis sp. subtype 4]KNB46762.1 hypothetical protein JH06_1410 [Blastocystis sp. subtype 4]|eukprot:XP_014530224.1 hypothetical protein JH06_1410 [Blastocystis sp. subtype 4]